MKNYPDTKEYADSVYLKSKLTFIFLFRCPIYASVRLKLFHENPTLLTIVNNIETFQFLCRKPYVLGKFIQELWHARTMQMKKFNNYVLLNNPKGVGGYVIIIYVITMY